MFLHCFHLHNDRICFRNYGMSALIFSKEHTTRRNVPEVKQDVNAVLPCMARVKWRLSSVPCLVLGVSARFVNQFGCGALPTRYTV